MQLLLALSQLNFQIKQNQKFVRFLSFQSCGAMNLVIQISILLVSIPLISLPSLCLVILDKAAGITINLHFADAEPQVRSFAVESYH